MENETAFLTIQAGAGGADACDWAAMVRKMYGRWAERNAYAVEEISSTPGDGGGIHAVSLRIEGRSALGRLAGEDGVHRLVRISPFDPEARRHTAFALVNVSNKNGARIDGDWGSQSQVRSYVMHPYQTVRDHRTKHEVDDIAPVLDGAIDGFIDAYENHRVGQ